MVCVFTRKTSEPLTSLVKRIDDAIVKNPALKSFVVQLTTTEAEGEVQKGLKELAARHEIKRVPLTLLDDPAGPGPYSVAREAEVTVVFWKDNKATATYGYRAGELSQAEVDRLIAEIPKFLSN